MLFGISYIFKECIAFLVSISGRGFYSRLFLIAPQRLPKNIDIFGQYPQTYQKTIYHLTLEIS